ncbi:LysR family transcriptional regulator [Pseudaminobacter salicylatoxidans]|uniref:LysR family transcriptional regulator n=1 Tax=Pseudaminobacter salicylatoxidans TaxID=93369 RepID=A0A316C908_PSESE|nr:LysR family transcriptional regulator [Pseudaminobacter salicylatoxidans]PWJ84507.1 LysR family transcriptional regulator [Pseudaminobacter salicylatoxidans]
MRLSLRTLNYVVTTADTGSVTEAARRLHVSQPSISAAIAHMEEEIGAQIFIRHHARGVTLTVAGRRVVNDARLLLNHARDFGRSISSLSDGLSGEITVGSFVTLATRFMPGLLAEFAQRVPGISINLEEGNQQEILDGLVSGRMEMALSYAYALSDEVVGEVLVELPPYVLVSADHPLAGRSSVRLKELAADPFILLDLPHSREYFFSLFLACKIEPRIVYRSRSYELIRGLVGHGHGYTIHNAVPGTTVGYDGSRIAVLPIEDKLPPVHVMSLSLRRQTMRPAARMFSDYLREAFAPGGLFGTPPARP